MTIKNWRRLQFICGGKENVHSGKIGKSTLSTMTALVIEFCSFSFVECQREVYLYIQICRICKSVLTTYCIKYVANTGAVCNLSANIGVICEQFDEEKIA